jgi:hypothetical protein
MFKENGFFVVWNPSGGVPMKRHPTLQLASEEAGRLAARNPGVCFFVLSASRAVVAEAPPPPAATIKVTKSTYPLEAFAESQ